MSLTQASKAPCQDNPPHWPWVLEHPFEQYEQAPPWPLTMPKSIHHPISMLYLLFYPLYPVYLQLTTPSRSVFDIIAILLKVLYWKESISPNDSLLSLLRTCSKHVTIILIKERNEIIRMLSHVFSCGLPKLLVWYLIILYQYPIVYLISSVPFGCIFHSIDLKWRCKDYHKKKTWDATSMIDSLIQPL